ncbi:AbrB family transcriptional regulator [Limnohabitans lacus]|uniref:AbrB family transcriptional regulator n=1 Tax=Limnohabitans lacus TaxID=3045173 RepID=A0ABT6X8J5_9BURK|nr:AbrB family transcriptional regulator [Limnohabitans sp. HM2-2]MDI9234457.1 AbrB family transcriptional regulator [Limnohabitans sp. HM2-2]
MISGLRVALTLLVALAAAELCVWLHTPIPWMLGPLIITALGSMAGMPTRSSGWLRNAGQWVIGVALGLYFTPEVSALVISLWWAIVLAIGWALLLGALFGQWLHRQHAADFGHLSPRALRATTYFSSAIGGASEMTLLSERHGARTDLVAAAHSVRLLCVVIAVPFGMQWAQHRWGLHVDASLLPGPRVAQWPGLLWLALVTALGAGVMVAIKRTNPWFMGPLLASMALTLSGVEWSAVPNDLSNAAQLVIGVSLGVRFRREFVHTAPQWLLSAAGGTFVMTAVSLGFGWLMAWLTGLHPATLILGTAPGGIAEMAITAKVLQLGVPVVTAFQVCRLVAVLLMVGPLFKWVIAQDKTA